MIRSVIKRSLYAYHGISGQNSFGDSFAKTFSTAGKIVFGNRSADNFLCKYKFL